jgi:hypothetical protein
VDECSKPPSGPNVSRSAQTDLFAAPTGLPEGFRYQPDVLSVEEAEALARKLSALAFKPFDFKAFWPIARW